jgi:hypothetical protein
MACHLMTSLARAFAEVQRGHAMADYRAYFVGADGHFRYAIPMDCISDDAAIEQTKQLLDGEDIELWQRARKVAAFAHKSRGTSTA